MAIPWLAVLRSVPWTEVIRNAPMLADGAKKLWSTVAKRTQEANESGPPVSAEADGVTHLTARVMVLESQLAELHEQMLVSSELIKGLADQNTQLIARIEANRIRLIRLAAVVAIIIVATTSVVLLGVMT